jgi:hypothetical protein
VGLRTGDRLGAHHMTIERHVASAFHLDENVWGRHTNPWSVWTRNSVLPLLALAIWSRAWIGWWAVLPSALCILWGWVNPRIFSKPRSTKKWASKIVLGERIWLNRDAVPVPKHHRLAPKILTGLSLAGLPFFAWGIIALDVWPTVFGLTVVSIGKFWFMDRMVWIYEEMKDADPVYRSWLY